jgi:hypothetical protein
VVEISFTPYKIVTDAGKGKEVDPEGVQAGLLEVGWCEGERNIGVQRVDGCVVTVRTADGAGSWGGSVLGPACEKGIESALVGDEGAEDVILDKMEEMIG